MNIWKQLDREWQRLVAGTPTPGWLALVGDELGVDRMTFDELDRRMRSRDHHVSDSAFRLLITAMPHHPDVAVVILHGLTPRLMVIAARCRVRSGIAMPVDEISNDLVGHVWELLNEGPDRWARQLARELTRNAERRHCRSRAHDRECDALPLHLQAVDPEIELALVDLSRVLNELQRSGRVSRDGATALGRFIVHGSTDAETARYLGRSVDAVKKARQRAAAAASGHHAIQRLREAS